MNIIPHGEIVPKDSIIISKEDYTKVQTIISEMRKGPPYDDETHVSAACRLFADRLSEVFTTKSVVSSIDGLQKIHLDRNVLVKKMKRADAYAIMGWCIPAYADGEDDGYLVIYNPLEPSETVTWSCKEGFDVVFGKSAIASLEDSVDTLENAIARNYKDQYGNRIHIIANNTGYSILWPDGITDNENIDDTPEHNIESAIEYVMRQGFDLTPLID